MKPVVNARFIEHGRRSSSKATLQRAIRPRCSFCIRPVPLCPSSSSFHLPPLAFPSPSRRASVRRLWPYCCCSCPSSHLPRHPGMCLAPAISLLSHLPCALLDPHSALLQRACLAARAPIPHTSEGLRFCASDPSLRLLSVAGSLADTSRCRCRCRLLVMVCRSRRSQICCCAHF